MIAPFFILALSSFVLSLLLTPLLRNVARQLGFVDHPDATRRIHSTPVPRIGGVPIVIAYWIAFLILLLTPRQGDVPVEQSLTLVWKLFPALLLIFGTGLLDDIIGLKPWQKLCLQIVAAGAATLSGVHVRSVASHPIGDWLSIPVTMFWLVACTNAFNLIDGVDGLASGVALSATLTTFAAAVLQSDSGLALATAPVAGALLGFLRYNFNPASIFLGDSGSLWLGFLLGCYGAVWSQKSATVLGMTAPLMALSIPLLDTALAIIRRFLRGEPVFGADLAHIHHRLLNRGLTPRRVALLLYGASGVAACFALTQSIVRNELRGLVLVLFCAAAWIGIRHLGYREFEVAARLIPLRHFRKSLEEQLRVSRFEDDLRTAVSIEDCWRAIHDAARDLGFTHVSANIARHSYDVGLGVSKDEHWTLRVPLSEADYVTLTHDGRYPGVPAVIAYFAESLHNSLRAKPLSFGAHTHGRLPWRQLPVGPSAAPRAPWPKRVMSR